MLPTALAALTLLTPQADAGETWDEIRKYWSVEVGAGFSLVGDTNGNVRDIPKAYADGQAAGDLPMGGSFFFRSIARYPMGDVAPALLFRTGYASHDTKGEIDGYAPYERQASVFDLVVGPGICINEEAACIFLTYGFRSIQTNEMDYPITNLEAVIGYRDDIEVGAFTENLLLSTLGADPLIGSLLPSLLETVDFSNQRVSIDSSDTFLLHGGMMSVVVGTGRRITVDAGLGGYVTSQQHRTSTRVVADLENPDEVSRFAYEWQKSLTFIAVDLGASVGLLPKRFPVQLALGLRGSSLIFVDLDPDRTVGSFVHGTAYLSAKW